jgi:hypothetical protein
VGLRGTREPTLKTEDRDVATEGAGTAVQVKRLIRKRIRKAGSGIDLVADVNASVSVNVNENRQTSPRTRATPPGSAREDAGGLDDRGRENA